MKGSLCMRNRRLIALGSVLIFSTAAPAQNPPRGRGGGFSLSASLSAQMLAQGDKNKDQKVTREELTALAEAWFEKLDPAKTGKVTQEQLSARLGELLPGTQIPAGGAGAPGGSRDVGGSPGPRFFPVIDADKDGLATPAELKRAFEKWAVDFDTDKNGSLNQEELLAG